MQNSGRLGTTTERKEALAREHSRVLDEDSTANGHAGRQLGLYY
jgi:hypothetical protein